MKKRMIVGLLMLAFMGSAMAQTQEQIDQMRREKIAMFNKRDISQQHLNGKYAQAPATQTTVKGDAKGELALPADRWFPGEWEEVKAIVVTCYYNYYPVDHIGDMYWTADPVVSGYADYYHYSNGWQQSGGGDYVAIPDTSNENFANVFFYIMDAIQLGGAEAWVRIEHAADSGAIIRKLDRMGLRSNNVKFIIGTGNSFWFRDCGPIAFYYGDQDSVAMVDFGYYPGRALDDSLPALIEEQFGIPNYITMIEWEGGNCLVDGAGMVLSSDAIYPNNRDTYGQITWDGVDPSTIQYTTKPSLTSAQVKDSLAHILGPRATYILPAFKYDGGTGHVDLYADMWDENEFVFSIMPENYSNWTDYKTGVKNMDSLTSYQSYFGLNYKSHGLPFPSTNNGGYFSSQTSYDNNYTRTYSNHTFVNNVIIQPCFSAVNNGVPSAQWDANNLEVIKNAYPGYTIYPIDVRSFDGSGGAIHCVTKQIPADNPVRILHPSITGDGNAYASTNATIRAEVTNRSGISEVLCVYRVNGGTWQQLALINTGNGNEFAGTMPTSTFDIPSGSYTTVEYYITATSVNGKTITKPMTANQGGYYTFYLGTNMPLAIDEVEEDMFGQFFPNPATNRASVRINMGNGMQYKVQIIDMMGRVAHTATLDAAGDILYNIDTQKLGNGIYNVVFTANDGTRVVRRIVVK
ncbi:MAG: agmatine deiminase family protein [Bacteroidales bacterium]|nr:agmatine deiminase family protein [Bacteroidales bacterium]